MPKHLLYGTVMYTVAGAATGVAVAMLTRYHPLSDRVYLQDSVPLALIGALFGGSFGIWVSRLHYEASSLRPWIEITSPILLFGSACMLIGWTFGDEWSRNRPLQMIWGGVVGSLVGLSCAIFQVQSDRREKPSSHLPPHSVVEDLLSRASRLDRAGNWDDAIAVYESVLNEPELKECHEYARNCIGLISGKRLGGNSSSHTS